jgi:hypothetical protein
MVGGSEAIRDEIGQSRSQEMAAEKETDNRIYEPR